MIFKVFYPKIVNLLSVIIFIVIIFISSENCPAENSEKECGEGQVCISTPVYFQDLVIKNGKTLENNTVEFTYSACSGADNEVNCANIGDLITRQMNGTAIKEARKELEKQDKEMAKFHEHMAEFNKHMDVLEDSIEKHMKNLEENLSGFGFHRFGWPFGDLDLEKRDVSSVIEEDDDGGKGGPSVSSYVMNLGKCGESSVKED